MLADVFPTTTQTLPIDLYWLLHGSLQIPSRDASLWDIEWEWVLSLLLDGDIKKRKGFDDTSIE